MKKFNLKDYKENSQIVTKEGNIPVTILSTDSDIYSPSGMHFPVVALAHQKDIGDVVIVADENGVGTPYRDFDFPSDAYDLYFVTHHFGWVAVLLLSENVETKTQNSIIFDTKGEAESWAEIYKRHFEENDDCKVLGSHIVEFEWYD